MSKTSIWIEGEGRKQKIIINKIMKTHRINIQKAMAISMINTRRRAHDYIIPNKAFNKYGRKIRNPRGAAYRQHTTPGRLTSRTGKIRYMLRNKLGGSSLRGWKGWGRINVKHKSIALLTQIKAERLTGKTERYIGTVRVKIARMDAYLSSTSGGRPRESLRTLAVRFNWETGIRGQRRPFFEPASKATLFDMRRLVRQKDANIRRAI